MKRATAHLSDEFKEILGIIQAGRLRAFEAVECCPIETYWAIGEQLCLRVSEAGWGKGVVADLASWLAAEAPDLKGFSSSKLWPHEAVFRDIFTPAKTRNTVARIVLVQAFPPYVQL